MISGVMWPTQPIVNYRFGAFFGFMFFCVRRRLLTTRQLGPLVSLIKGRGIRIIWTVRWKEEKGSFGELLARGATHPWNLVGADYPP